MKYFIQCIATLFVSVLLFSSCADEIDQQQYKKVIEGIPVEATFSFQTGDASFVTKATAAEEDYVGDLYVLIFNEDESFSNGQYFNNVDNSNSVKLWTTSGEKKIYAIANITGNSFTSAGVHLKAKIDEFVGNSGANTLDDWKKLSASINTEQVTWAEGRFPMSGCFVSDENGDSLSGDVLPEDGSCIINTNGTVSKAGKIHLVRMVSSISFNLKLGEKVTSLSSVSWEVHNVPKSVYLNRQEKAGTPGDTDGDTDDAYFSASDAGTNNGTAFQFYMLENRQETGETCDQEPNTYEEADWREKHTMKGDVRVFTNAPKYGTYVVLKGYYDGKADNPFNKEKDDDATGNVTYYIHLGYVDGATDFSIKRNYKYTYNVTIEGIDKIIVEADNKGETDRADGVIIFPGTEILLVDAHYDRVEITLDNISSVGDILCGISTAKTGFEYKDLTDDLTEDERDTDWVHFIEKGKVGAERPNFSTYGTLNNNLMTIGDLIDKFKVGGEYHGNDGEIELYAYVKENYYDDLPLDKFISYSAVTGEAKSRQLMIAVTRSNGGNSSVSMAKYVIKQRPIVSIYDMTSEAVVNGGKTWGMEWINENLPKDYWGETTDYDGKAGAGLPYGLDQNKRRRGTDYYEDGLANMRVELDNGGVRRWNNGAIQASAYAACMSRNRDENGNGSIEPAEIKWYLPAINQYQHFWLGMYAVPVDATLYPKEYRNNEKWEYYHYASSGGHLFWAEEGCATSYDLQEYGDLGYEKYHVRCARNIYGKDTDEYSEQLPLSEDLDPRDDDDGKGTYTLIDVSGRLTAESLRASVASQMTMHDEYEEGNKLYGKIYVRDTKIAAYNDNEQRLNGPGRDWMTTASAVYGSSNPCLYFGEGWRAPSQRELILMTTVLVPENDVALFSSTYFSLWNYGTSEPKSLNPRNEPRIGFYFTSSYMSLITPTKRGNEWSTSDKLMFIRCVKDATD